MSKKLKAIQYLFVLFFIISFIVILVLVSVQSRNISSVSSVRAKTVSSDSIDLSWKRDNSVDGYFIYQYNKDSDGYETIADLPMSENKYSVENLSQATEYCFYVTAYRNLKNDVLESSEYKVVKAITLPEKVKVTDTCSVDEGQLLIEWKNLPNIDGYLIEYCENEDFKSSEVIEVENRDADENEITGLTVGKVYYSRICAYINYGGNTVKGDWSDAEKTEIADKIELPDDIDPSKPMIALTFDDGPGYNNVSDRILDTLEKYNAKATFFMVGTNASDHPENLKRKIKLGCELGNHTYTHEHYGKKVTAKDIYRASDAIYEACGQYPTAFRSPGGNTTSVIRKQCKKEGMPLYYWSIDTEDWKSRDADKIYKTVMKNVKDGDIILMHEIYSSTADAVEKLVPALIKKGYQLVTCQQLVAAKTGKEPKPGTQYYNATTVKNSTK